MARKKQELSPLEQAELQLKAAKRLLTARKAQDSLLDFVRMMMPDPEDPDNTDRSRYAIARHHEVFAAALEAVEKGEIPRLIITVPPRHGKSLLSSKAFPAWFMGRDPYRQMIVASYSSTMAEDFGREVRQYMQSPTYQQIFPNCKLRKGGASSDRIQTEQGGIGVFVGAGGALTGRGADCLTGDTLVITDKGEIPIKKLVRVTSPCKALSINEYGQLEWRDIKAIANRKADGYFKITTANGRVVKATGEHPFYVDGEWKKADQLASGDRLLCTVSKDRDKKSVRDEQDGEKGVDRDLLLEQLRVQPLQRETREDREALQGMRNNHVCKKIWSLLLSCLQGDSKTKKDRGEQGKMANGLVQDLRSANSNKLQHGDSSDMREKVRSNASLRADEQDEQSRIPPWPVMAREGTSQRKSFQDCKNICEEEGSERVRSLRQPGGASYSSHRHKSTEQQNDKFGDVMQKMSLSVSRWGEVKTEEDTVLLVERICEPTVVWNIQVEGTENFFANGICCHNCLLIDDPVKDREDADSVTMRNKLWNWFTDVAMTRLMGGMGRAVIIMTRWHEDDIVGRLTDPNNQYYNADEAKQWKIIHFTALAEDGDIMGREKDEPLWPERITKEFLVSQRRLNPRGFAALYQGRPAPEEGDFFKREWLATYQPADLPRNLRIYCASDHAVSTAQDRDPTVLMAAGVDEQDNIWILPDLWWRREETDTVVDAMLEMMARHKPLIWWAERGHISKSIGPFLRKRMQEEQIYCAIDEVVPVKDKQTRAQAIRGRMAMGKVRFPGFAPWWEAARHQMLTFPSGKHDDVVDVLGYLGLGLGRMTTATSPVRKKAEPATGTLAWVKYRSDIEARYKAQAKTIAGF
jgi:predicted phage terminase large subunit-like protein